MALRLSGMIGSLIALVRTLVEVAGKLNDKIRFSGQEVRYVIDYYHVESGVQHDIAGLHDTVSVQSTHLRAVWIG